MPVAILETARDIQRAATAPRTTISVAVVSLGKNSTAQVQAMAAKASRRCGVWVRSIRLPIAKLRRPNCARLHPVELGQRGRPPGTRGECRSFRIGHGKISGSVLEFRRA